MNTWIKMRSNLELVAEFIRMQRALQIDPMTLTGALFRFWNFIDQNSRHGEVPCEWDDIDQMTLKGFAAALSAVGWLERDEDGLRIPNFSRYSNCSAKQRQSPEAVPRKTAPKAASRVRDARGRYIAAGAPAKNRVQSAGVPCSSEIVFSTEMDSPLDSTAVATLGSSAAPSWSPCGVHHGPLQLVENIHVTPQRPSREEKNREEQNKEEGKRDAFGGGDAAIAPPPPFSFPFFLEVAKECGLTGPRAEKAYAGLAERNFRDRHGQPVRDLARYLRRCASQPTVHAQPREPAARPKQLWQIESDLKRVEERIKREADHYKPDHALIKALKIQRERFKQEMIACVQAPSAFPHAHAA